MLKRKSALEEHSLLITDVRFSPGMTRLATSSFDKTVRVWDADNVYAFLYSLPLEIVHSNPLTNLLPVCSQIIRSVLLQVIQRLSCHLIFIRTKKTSFVRVIVMVKCGVGA